VSSTILGILASSGAAAGGAYESIATVTGNGSATSLNFSSITSAYSHLQIRWISYDGTGNALYLRFNDDSGNNYTFHQVYGNGSTAAAGGFTSQSGEYIGFQGYNGSSYRTTGIVDILDYANANKYKTTRSIFGADFNNTQTGYVMLNSNLWLNSAAITKITIYSSTAFDANSQFALYGIKAA